MKQRAKNHVKSFSKLYFYIYTLMWCPFNDMLIKASCSLLFIWMLKNLYGTIGSFDFEF